MVFPTSIQSRPPAPGRIPKKGDLGCRNDRLVRKTRCSSAEVDLEASRFWCGRVGGGRRLSAVQHEFRADDGRPVPCLRIRVKDGPDKPAIIAGRSAEAATRVGPR